MDSFLPFGLDQKVQAFVGEIQHPLVTDFFVELTQLGSVVTSLGIIGGLWLADEDDTAILGAIGVTVTAVLVKGMKMLFQRTRPENMSPFLSLSASPYAFPSGHTAIAFLMATLLSHRIGRRTEQVYLYTLAALVGFSRVYLGAHYVSDVIVGAALGTTLGIVINKQEQQILPRIKTLNSFQ